MWPKTVTPQLFPLSNRLQKTFASNLSCWFPNFLSLIAWLTPWPAYHSLLVAASMRTRNDTVDHVKDESVDHIKDDVLLIPRRRWIITDSAPKVGPGVRNTAQLGATRQRGQNINTFFSNYFSLKTFLKSFQEYSTDFRKCSENFKFRMEKSANFCRLCIGTCDRSQLADHATPSRTQRKHNSSEYSSAFWFHYQNFWF